jgi:CRP-like cAMP-binding protein
MNHPFDKVWSVYSNVNLSPLKDDIENNSRRIYLEKGTLMEPRSDEILFLVNGNMSISNNPENGLLLGYSFPLMPIGLLERYYPHIVLCYKAEESVTLAQMSHDEFDNMAKEHAFLFTHILTHMIANLIEIYFERNNESSYATIRRMLFRYMARDNAREFNTDGIASFILKRTKLSRSYVFQILAGLKSGGYITIKNGRLLSINRDIPLKF